MAASSTDDKSSLPGPKNRTLAIFLVSVLGLFLEMLLIRWIGTEIRIFAYLQNTILIVCFLGLGLGCFTCRREIKLRGALVPLLCIVGLLAVPAARNVVARISVMLSGADDLVMWEYERVESGWWNLSQVALGLVLTLMLMLLVCEIFIPLGRLLGRHLDDHPQTIWAYCVNVGGSLVGIWLFALMSALHASPLIWFAVAAAMLLAFAGRGRELQWNGALLGCILLAAGFANYRPDALEATWSPYQKLVLTENQPKDVGWRGQYLITVNNAAYQGIADLSSEGLEEIGVTPGENQLSQYDVPLLLKPNPRSVLIVGAGSGNDVAGALRGGAGRVVAVEIDPAIIEMGKQYHPERPYQAPEVVVVNDDARSYFETSTEKFDLIIFGLLDSHTTTAMTNARLDHYVYTKESIEQARSLLTHDGVMALTFEAQRPYIADRIEVCLREVFGHAPMAFVIPQTNLGWGGTMFVTGNQDSVQAALAGNAVLADQIEQWRTERPLELAGVTAPAVDDWPYLYLENRRIPTLYLLLGVLVLALVLHYRKRFGIWSPSAARATLTRANMHFFFLGAAFLLLEVQNISKASLVLGNTWIVNGVIISGILLMILLANFVASIAPRLPQLLIGSCLIGSCVALYFVNLSAFGSLPYASKALVVGLITTLPMFFAGLLFIRSFATTQRKNEALGANLLGALVGGMLECLTFVIGVKALLLLVAALYALALYTRPRKAQSDDQDQRLREVLLQPTNDDAEQPIDEPELVGA